MLLLDNKLVDAYGNRCVAYYAIGEDETTKDFKKAKSLGANEDGLMAILDYVKTKEEINYFHIKFFNFNLLKYFYSNKRLNNARNIFSIFFNFIDFIYSANSIDSDFERIEFYFFKICSILTP